MVTWLTRQDDLASFAVLDEKSWLTILLGSKFLLSNNVIESEKK